jgi:acetyl-CoA acyltransferase
VELLVSITVTAIIAASVAATVSAVAVGMQGQDDAAQEVARLARGQARLADHLFRARMILSQSTTVFAMGGSVTAGNASQTSDGAAFVLVVSEKFMEQYKLKPIAKMLSYAAAGVEPSLMGIGPVEAIPIALKKAGLKLEDIDLIELNEAFAAQSLAVIKTLGIDQEKVNVNGGAIALGHPLGCSGAKLSIQLFHELRRRNKKYGMVTACVGGGQGVAGIYEIL